jgi:lipopolysaccharide/colanic/teichoic acid biosynthesis glycosyltransferase
MLSEIDRHQPATDGVLVLPRRKTAAPRPVLPLESMLVRPLPRGKRAVDLIVAPVMLILLAPVFMLIMLAIWLADGRPIFFVQERTGLGLRRFKMYKFRTMVKNAPECFAKIRHLNQMTGPLVKIAEDPRLIAIGSFLRRTSLDELPQLYNVLKGDMTLIGPRALSPLPLQFAGWQRRRFAVTPGLACSWQAERRAGRDFDQWMRHDLRYIEKTSFWGDMLLGMKILIQVILCNGAS